MLCFISIMILLLLVLLLLMFYFHFLPAFFCSSFCCSCLPDCLCRLYLCCCCFLSLSQSAALFQYEPV